MTYHASCHFKKETANYHAFSCFVRLCFVLFLFKGQRIPWRMEVYIFRHTLLCNNYMIIWYSHVQWNGISRCVNRILAYLILMIWEILVFHCFFFSLVCFTTMIFLLLSLYYRNEEWQSLRDTTIRPIYEKSTYSSISCIISLKWYARSGYKGKKTLNEESYFLILRKYNFM